jgi:outer membrane lipoprotein-sorting protein
MELSNELTGRGRVRPALLWMAAWMLLSAGHSAGAERRPDPEADPNAVAPVSFIRDGRLDVDAVVDYFEDLYRADSSISTAEIKVVKPRRTKSMRLKMWTQGREKALVVVQAPPREEGIATLKVDDNLWNYFPRIRRTIRIPPSMMQSSWLGTDFTNDDLVRESRYDKDYYHELVGHVEDPNGWLVRFTAKPETVGLWERFDLIVSPDGTIPIQAKYYDRKGRHARTLYWDDVKVFDRRRLPAHLKLVPEDKEGEWTEMLYLDIDFNVGVPASTFSLSELERTR